MNLNKKLRTVKLMMFFFIPLASYSQSPEDCIDNSFSPVPGEKYVVSAWVKDDVNTQEATYQGFIRVINNYGSSGSNQVDFTPSGNIIDGWQRIIGEFTLHPATTYLEIKLVSKEGETSFFDDIRFFPYNGNMKSFVYDPVTLRLTAELDENNYATIYEYDNEGGLIRIKKETEQGVYTIQESRSSNTKMYAE